MVKIDIENTRKAGGRMEEVKTIILKDVLPFVDPVARSHARRVLKDAEGYKELVMTAHSRRKGSFAHQLGKVDREVHIQPTTSALLHNTSTLVIGLKSMQNLID